MQFTTSLAVALITIFILFFIAIIFLIVRKLETKNTVVAVNRKSVSWDTHKCPNCRNTLEQGFAFPPRGVIWTQSDQKTPGVFITINQSLENTLSMRLSPAVNKAWRCASCKMLVMDYSQMLKIKNT